MHCIHTVEKNICVNNFLLSIDVSRNSANLVDNIRKYCANNLYKVDNLHPSLYLNSRTDCFIRVCQGKVYRCTKVE